jgi:hypothetical protein
MMPIFRRALRDAMMFLHFLSGGSRPDYRPPPPATVPWSLRDRGGEFPTMGCEQSMPGIGRCQHQRQAWANIFQGGVSIIHILLINLVS